MNGHKLLPMVEIAIEKRVIADGQNLRSSYIGVPRPRECHEGHAVAEALLRGTRIGIALMAADGYNYEKIGRSMMLNSLKPSQGHTTTRNPSWRILHLEDQCSPQFHQFCIQSRLQLWGQ
uniref:CMP/dCMP-type deaminase domain-containing protein n=1 Tax=Bursaphelenchus xylophilus TaxID=6326 RepID=A0A1I7S7W9_BURXY